LVVLHGGPDFDHSYFLPELDRLSDAFRLIYYDQRGRGKSADGVQPEDVTIESDVEDLDRLREYFGLERVALMGHSWGGLLALEYAIRHPDRVSRLILINTAPVSHDDFSLMRQELPKERAPADLEKLNIRPSDPLFQEGDPDTVAAYYRIHFRPTMRQPEQLESMVERLRASFTKEGVLKARAIEDRLVEETWLRSDYDLLPKLANLSIPTLVLRGDYDFIPRECAERVASAIPEARFVELSNCGHFSYLERPDEFREAVAVFMQGD